ncbi:MAG: hypothetical protein HY392_03545 [Candidatus Diapherotrites archaeon]|nr:hypothetical protein [Candidatus Diapherotrites archaeon]
MSGKWRRKTSTRPKKPKTPPITFDAVPRSALADIQTLRNLASAGRIHVLDLNPATLADFHISTLVKRAKRAHEIPYSFGKRERLDYVNRAQKIIANLIRGDGIDLKQYNFLVQWLRTKRVRFHCIAGWVLWMFFIICKVV